VQACGRLDELIYQLGKEITRAAAEKPPADPDEVTASENAIATSMVLCEGVRAVLDMKRGGPRTAREDDEQELGTDAYDAAVKSAREDRDSLARMADTEARRDADSAGTADPDRDRR
jgi:hypothetical protein